MLSSCGGPLGQLPSMSEQQHWDAPAQPRFQTIRFLGKGGQGFVQLAHDNLLDQDVAIKYIDRGWSRGFYKYVLRETLNHQQLSLCKHPHIVEFHEVFLTPSYLAVVMEYVHGMNLQHYLEDAGGKLPEDIARFIFQQLMIAVDFCHKKGKVNRDIKLANILLQEGPLPLVKLCDFGFSKDKFDDSEPQTQIGTALFTAPEIFTNVPGKVYDAEAADIWSCGVVLFVMLFGCHPFLSVEDTQQRKHAQVMKLIENAVRGNVQLPTGAAELYPQAVDLVRSILVSAPNQRCKLPDIMAHPWFQSKLPPGALLLNAAYLAMEHPVGELRQTPEEVHAIITAALSVSPQEEKPECSSAAAADGPAASEVSRTLAGASPLSPPGPQHGPPQHFQLPLSAGHSHALQQAPTQPSLGSAMSHGPPLPAQLPMTLHPQQLAVPQSPGASLLPQHMHQQQHLPLHPQRPQHMSQSASVVAQPSGSMHWQAMEAGCQQAPSEDASAAGLIATLPSVQSVTAPGVTIRQMPESPALQHARAPEAIQPQFFHQPSPGLTHVTAQQSTGPASSPMALGTRASLGLGSGTASGSARHGLIGTGSGSVPPLDEAAVTAMRHAAAEPNAMEVSGCVLYDSSLLYRLDLQAES